MAVHESMRLYITPERFFVEPTDSDESEVLIIDRVSQEISLESNQGQIPPGAASKFICGIFGIIRLLAGPYLLLITRRVKVGEIGGQSIWRVADTEVIPYKKTLLHLTETQMNDNKIYLSMLDQMLKAEFFYFSTTHDLSHSLQRLSNTSPDFKQLALHERADQRFIWNHHVLRELTQQPELSKYCLPVMHGFVFIKSAIVKGKTFDYALISRRSCLRAGTRYFIRGINSEGHAANFVETEQIVEYEGSMCSFVQTRGSIPMFWSQRPNLKYKPDPVLSTKENQLLGMKTHLDEQIFNYGRLILVDLIDQKGKELTLGSALADNVRNVHNDNIRLESFDFHKECSKMRWERLNILMDRIEADRKEMGYFTSLRDGTMLSQQTGVFRTNCIDCLDRTNVVQSLIARRTLQDQLIRLNILQEGEKVEDQLSFERMYKNVWADNADLCAKQYAGTGALKTDFTRTGKRSFLGLLKDGYNSTIRYFKNNFSDGFRQDAMDLFLGNYIVEEDEGVAKLCPLRQERDWKYLALPAIFMVAFSMCVISVLIPDEHATETLMYIVFWGGASLVSLGLIYYYGDEFVDQPKLAQTKTKVE